MKKIEPYTPYWQKLANEEARTYAPEIYPCATCGHPVIAGYCCDHCKSNDPHGDESRKANGKDGAPK